MPVGRTLDTQLRQERTTPNVTSAVLLDRAPRRGFAALQVLEGVEDAQPQGGAAVIALGLQLGRAGHRIIVRMHAARCDQAPGRVPDVGLVQIALPERTAPTRSVTKRATGSAAGQEPVCRGQRTMPV